MPNLSDLLLVNLCFDIAVRISLHNQKQRGPSKHRLIHTKKWHKWHQHHMGFPENIGQTNFSRKMSSFSPSTSYSNGPFGGYTWIFHVPDTTTRRFLKLGIPYIPKSSISRFQMGFSIISSYWAGWTEFKIPLPFNSTGWFAGIPLLDSNIIPNILESIIPQLIINQQEVHRSHCSHLLTRDLHLSKGLQSS